MNDKLNNFFKEREKYMTTDRKKCLGCSRTVGTKFSTEVWESKRVYKMTCGNEDEPCNFNETIEVKKNKHTYGEMLKLQEKLLNLQSEISKVKSKLVCDIIMEEVYKEQFAKLENDYKKTLIQLSAIQKHISIKNQQYKDKSELLKKMIEDNKKIPETHIRMNHYLSNIHDLKSELSMLDEIIVEYKNTKNFDTSKTFTLQKNVKKKI
tara:strand:+ start:23520 stop:24143 length:624 start_codon:yes stop_codon:yes gene_type:complete